MFLGIIPRPAFIEKHRSVYFSKRNVSEIRFCPRLQVKHSQLDSAGRASPYLRISMPALRWGIQANHSINHLRELRKH
jgi:hypothetical protein